MGGIEFEILYFLQTLHTPWLDTFMKFVTYLGDKGLIWIVLGAALLVCKRTRRIGIAVLLSLLLGLLIGNGLLKNLAARSRPCWIDESVALLIANPSDYSFPSGHTLAGFEAAFSVLFARKRWGWAVLGLAVLIALSRLYLFVHFPSDVLAGAVIGTAVAWLVSKGMERFQKEASQ